MATGTAWSDTPLSSKTTPVRSPLPWSDFFIARGRALAAHGSGKRDDETMQELRRLRDEADRDGLKTASPAIEEAIGVEPAVVLADAGYCNEPDLLELEDRGIDAHVALGREGKSQVAVDPARLPATHRMGEKLASPAGKARYAQRKWLSEAPNGWIKEVLGFRRYTLRGLAKVSGEWDLVCLALNIKRMGTLATC